MAPETDLAAGVSTLETLYCEIEAITGRITFDKRNPQHLCAVSLHGSIVELASACIVLLKLERYSGVPVLARSMLEAFVDLANVAESEDYHKSMNANFLKEKRKFYDEALKLGNDNPYTAELLKILDVAYELQKTRDELDQLKSAGITPSSIGDRFKSAGMVNEYASMYSLLCLHSHNNVSVLEARHLEKDTDGDYHLTLFKEVETDEMDANLDTIAGTLTGSIRTILKILEQPDDGTVARVESIREEIRRVTSK